MYLLPAGCAVNSGQSTLQPAGPAAAEIAWLWWLMCAVFTAVLVLVVVLLIIAITPSRRHASRLEQTGQQRDVPPWGPNGFVIAGGIVLPILILTPLSLISLRTSATLVAPREALTVRVIGHMWWWEVRYPDTGLVTANEIHIPAGEPVRLELASADVIHSFWVPSLHGKRDMIPGLETSFWIQADEPGIYRGQCAEYCGTQHANMALLVVALPREQFDAWLSSGAGNPGHEKVFGYAPSPIQPSEAPREGKFANSETNNAQRGHAVFMQAGCAQCHAIAGTQAKGNAGPDLTRMGRRATIGAALLPNTPGNLAGWIADPQALKPGVKMPRTYLSSNDLLALVMYLEDLK
jgi:cytochrome c oxidase subunit 2